MTWKPIYSESLQISWCSPLVFVMAAVFACPLSATSYGIAVGVRNLQPTPAQIAITLKVPKPTFTRGPYRDRCFYEMSVYEHKAPEYELVYPASAEVIPTTQGNVISVSVPANRTLILFEDTNYWDMSCFDLVESLEIRTSEGSVTIKGREIHRLFRPDPATGFVFVLFEHWGSRSFKLRSGCLF